MTEVGRQVPNGHRQEDLTTKERIDAGLPPEELSPATRLALFRNPESVDEPYWIRNGRKVFNGEIRTLAAKE